MVEHGALSVTAVARAAATFHPGPSVASLAQRLSLTPPDFLDPAVDVPALLADVVHTLSGSAADSAVWTRLDTSFGPTVPAPVRQVAGLVSWLVLTPELLRCPGLGPAVARRGGLAPWFVDLVVALGEPLALAREPRTCVHDVQGREEAARAFLAVALLLPAGESPAMAADRWQAVSSLHRREVAGAVGQQARRAEELARLLADKRAKEAAAQYANY